MIERPLEGFEPVRDEVLRNGDTEVALQNRNGYTLRCSLVADTVLRTQVTGPNLPLPPSCTVLKHAQKPKPLHIHHLAELESRAKSILFSASNDARFVIRLSWSDTPVIEIFWRKNRIQEQDGLTGSFTYTLAFSDLPFRSYSRTEHGIARYTHFDGTSVHLGLGERAAPLDLTKRYFTMGGSDSASYDAYLTDPLYKHTPFLIAAPRPPAREDDEIRPSVGILSASNADSQWDVGRFVDEPWKTFKKYTQDWGGLDEYIMVEKDPESVVKSFASLVGFPQLVPRAWLGYLASGMGLGESDDPPAQFLLEDWPNTCRQYGIPCSAMHLSSGYTVDEKTGDRMVFTMNTKRYPNFAGMVEKFHKAGIAVAPNIKPYVLTSHPDFEHLKHTDALFRDPATNEPVITRIWASSIGVNAQGSWIDTTSRAGRAYWRDGVAGLVKLGVDGIWNDNNEYTLHDDEFECGAEFSDGEDQELDSAYHNDHDRRIGLIGRMRSTHEMARCSADVLRTARPNKRPLVLTRSANISTMRHASSSWSGDNRTSWTSLRGSVAMALNAQISLISSYGADVGGFGGPQPSPELLARWIQLGVMHPRFCIHSYKPTAQDPSGKTTTTLPWMYKETFPAIQELIRRRYELLPFWNDLQWRSHLNAEPCNSPLFWGPFANDANLYPPSRRTMQDEQRDGHGLSRDAECLDYWIGTGRILFCGQYFENSQSRTAYLPRKHLKDDAFYYDLHAPYKYHKAGSTISFETPIEHGGIFVREGTILPIGKPCVTSTIDVSRIRECAESAFVTGTGTAKPALLAKDGGVVELDDWRGIEIFPPPPVMCRGSSAQHAYTDQWIEDDGESIKAPQAVIQVSFAVNATGESVEPRSDDDYDFADSSGESDQVVGVHAKYLKRDFEPLWGNKLHVLLPRGDARAVRGAQRKVLDNGRVSWVLQVMNTSR